MEGINGNGAAIAGAATYGFSAKPQVISGKGPYRDPYREYM
jgi:hypothetical protein